MEVQILVPRPDAGTDFGEVLGTIDAVEILEGGTVEENRLTPQL